MKLKILVPAVALIMSGCGSNEVYNDAVNNMPGIAGIKINAPYSFVKEKLGTRISESSEECLIAKDVDFAEVKGETLSFTKLKVYFTSGQVRRVYGMTAAGPLSNSLVRPKIISLYENWNESMKFIVKRGISKHGDEYDNNFVDPELKEKFGMRFVKMTPRYTAWVNLPEGAEGEAVIRLFNAKAGDDYWIGEIDLSYEPSSVKVL